MSGPDDTTHQLDVCDRRPAWPEPGRRLHIIGAGCLRKRPGRHLLFVGQQRGLDDDLAEHAAVPAGADHGGDISFDDAKVAGLERADIDDHVHFGRAVENHPAGLVLLHVAGRGAERKPDNGAHAADAAPQQSRGQRHPGG